MRVHSGHRGGEFLASIRVPFAGCSSVAASNLRLFLAICAVALLPRRLARAAVEALATQTWSDIALEAFAFVVACCMQPWRREIVEAS